MKAVPAIAGAARSVLGPLLLWRGNAWLAGFALFANVGFMTAGFTLIGLHLAGFLLTDGGSA